MKKVIVFALLAVASTVRWRKQRRRATIPRLKTDRRCAEDWAFGAIAQNSPYAGEGMRVQPIPLISYEREHSFFAASPRAGSSSATSIRTGRDRPGAVRWLRHAVPNPGMGVELGGFVPVTIVSYCFSYPLVRFRVPPFPPTLPK
jgi:hypothetical protein